MIAIPVDTASMDSKSSELFGNVNAFAIYNKEEDTFHFVPNSGQGDGVATAKALDELSVSSVVYSYMGNGPFGALQMAGMNVFYIGKTPLGLAAIVEGIETNNFVQVDVSNAKKFLDPGTSGGSCECGCSHD